MILDAIHRNGLAMINFSKVREDIDERMNIYSRSSTPKVYINVGGGVASAGIRPAKRFLKTGLLRGDLPPGRGTDSVIHRFVDQGIPVIHLENVRLLAKAYGLPQDPAAMPKVGEGTIYYNKEYNLWLAGSLLAAIIFGLYIFVRVDWGFQMLRAAAKEEVGPPEPMV